MDEFEGNAIQPFYNPRPSVDFRCESQIHADLTKAYMNVRLGSNVETDFEVSVSPKTPDKLAPQRRQPAQKPWIDVGKTTKAAAAQACVSKLRSSRPGTSGDAS